MAFGFRRSRSQLRAIFARSRRSGGTPTQRARGLIKQGTIRKSRATGPLRLRMTPGGAAGFTKGGFQKTGKKERKPKAGKDPRSKATRTKRGLALKTPKMRLASSTPNISSSQRKAVFKKVGARLRGSRRRIKRGLKSGLLKKERGKLFGTNKLRKIRGEKPIGSKGISAGVKQRSGRRLAKSLVKLGKGRRFGRQK